MPNWSFSPFISFPPTWSNDYDIKDLPKVELKDGCICEKCEEYYPYAVPNQSDGTLICWSCRHFY